MGELSLDLKVIFEGYFTEEEMKEIERELGFHSGMEFLVMAIRSYLNTTESMREDNNSFSNHQLEEIKSLVNRNYSLLKNLNKGQIFEKDDENKQGKYQREEQEAKTEQVLNLLEQF